MFGLVLKNNRFRRTSVVFLGMVVHFVAFYLIFLNIPDDAPVVLQTSSQHKPYLAPRYNNISGMIFFLPNQFFAKPALQPISLDKIRVKGWVRGSVVPKCGALWQVFECANVCLPFIVAQNANLSKQA